MAVERFSNLAETTLAAGYTSGGASISVASASGFPTDGVFRVRLGNTGKTIFRVDSVSGTTFTGGAEANDADASSGATAVLVATKAVAERFLQSPETSGILAPTGVSAVDFFGPLWKTRGVVDSEFSWVNQGGASHANIGGVARLSVPAQTQNVRARMKSFPSSDFTVTALLIPELRTSASAEVGLIFRETATDKWQGINLRNDSVVYVSNWTSAAAIASNQYSGVASTSYVRYPTKLWLRIAYNGTNVIFSESLDGVHWTQRLSEAKTARFTTAPDQVGYFVNDRTNSLAQAMSVLSWLET